MDPAEAQQHPGISIEIPLVALALPNSPFMPPKAAAKGKAKAKAKAKALAGGPAPYVGVRRTPDGLVRQMDHLNADLGASGFPRIMEHALQSFRRPALTLDDLQGVTQSANRFLRSRDLFVRGLIRNGAPAATIGAWGAPPGVTRIWVDSNFAAACQRDWDGMLQAAGGFDELLAQLDLENIPPPVLPGAAPEEDSSSSSDSDEE